MAEFYPMPMFVKLQVKNISESVHWYGETLGFQPVFEMNGMAHLRGERCQDLMLLAAGDIEETRGVGVVINFNAADIDTLYEKARARSAHIVEELLIRPWNTREFAVKDPDGYLLTFSVPVDIERKFEDVIAGI